MDVLATEQVCIPAYSHEYNVLSVAGCGYAAVNHGPKPAILAGHFMWLDYDWMLATARVRVRASH